MMLIRSGLPCVLLATSALAQTNAPYHPNTDLNVYQVGSGTIYGRDGAPYPNGRAGVGYGHAFCTTENHPWVTSPTWGLMTSTHFMIAFLVVRESNGRMVQVSKPETGVKHSRVTYNLGSSQCGTCQSGPSGFFRSGCYDAYSTGYNGDRFNLAPSNEINPWLGTWNPVGSYFDRGDPAVGGAAATDGVQSLTNSQIQAFGPVKNRITIDETDLSQPGTYYGQVHLVAAGESVTARHNNLRSAEFGFSWNGSSWSISNQGSQLAGTVLGQWTGATVNEGHNGNDDGRFAVAAKVTGPVAGLYRYEYAVHNIDNHRGGASFRIPLSAAVTVQNAGFRDIDTNSLNEWTFSQTASELSWTASATNPLDWNTIYNFYFDCDTAPGQGGILIDQARIGPGALQVALNSEVPGGVPTALVAPIGSSCGDCDSVFYEYFATAQAMDLSNSSATMTLANGDYTVGTGTAAYQTPSGTNLMLGDDAQAIVTLPFTLPYPGGSTTSVRVCSNGFVSPGGNNGTLWIPFTSLLLNQYPRWAVAWHDFAPHLGGGVIHDSSPTSVTFTWLNVPNSGTSAPGTSTFQIQLQANGTVHMIWQNMSTNGNAYLVGWSPGGGASDPGSVDLTTALPAGISLCDNLPIDLTTSARPIVGTTIQHMVSPVDSATPFGGLVLSLVQALPPIDLAPYGMPGCFAHTSGGVNQLWFPAGAASVSIPLTIPNDPGLMGVQIVSQSYAWSPPLTPLGLIASNGLLLLLGAL